MKKNINKIITSAAVISFFALTFNTNIVLAFDGSAGQTGSFTQTLAPRLAAPAPAAPAPALVAAPRDEDQVAAKDKETDFVLQKAARN